MGVQVKLRSLENTSVSEVMIHEEVLYEVYIPLPLPAQSLSK